MTIPIVIVSTVLNAERYVGRCIRSVREQTFTGWKHIVVDAKSDDNTVSVATSAASIDTEIIAQQERLSVFDNFLPVCRSLSDETIIVWLDGDDWLANDTALAQVHEAHKAGALVTYGQFMWRNGRVGFAAPTNTIRPRSVGWTATHLKTFRAGLVKQIKDEDLRTPDGQYSCYATDQNIMLPCLELSGGWATFIPNILYVYNDDHSWESASGPQNSVDRAEFLRAEHAEVARIRTLPRYEPMRWTA